MISAPISKVIVKRFRSFPAANLGFENPLFIVGRNGSERAIWQMSFPLFQKQWHPPLQAVFDRRGGIATVRNRSSVRSAPPNLGLAFEFGPFNSATGGRFPFEIKALPNHGYKIVREHWRSPCQTTGHTRKPRTSLL